MGIVRYDPPSELRTLGRETKSSVPASTRVALLATKESGRCLGPTSIFARRKDQIVLEAEPGMNQEDFDLSIENSVITLEANASLRRRTTGDNYHRV